MADGESQMLTLCWECVCRMEADHDIQWVSADTPHKGRCEHCGKKLDRLWRYKVGPQRRKRKVRDDACKGCAYGADIFGWVRVCQYILVHKACRPCPARRYCTVRKEDRKLARWVQTQACAELEGTAREVGLYPEQMKNWWVKGGMT